MRWKLQRAQSKSEVSFFLYFYGVGKGVTEIVACKVGVSVSGPKRIWYFLLEMEKKMVKVVWSFCAPSVAGNGISKSAVKSERRKEGRMDGDTCLFNSKMKPGLYDNSLEVGSDDVAWLEGNSYVSI